MKQQLIIIAFCSVITACSTATSRDSTSGSSIEMYGVIDAGVGVQEIKR